MRGVLLDPTTGKPGERVSVPASSEVEEWKERVGREEFHKRNRELLTRSQVFQNTTTTNRYLCYPAAAAGASLATGGGAAWANPASYTQVVPASTITATFYIAAVIFQPPAATTAATLYEYEIDIATGAAASEVVAMTVAFTIKNVTAAGYIPPMWLDLPEPKQISANARISARVRYNTATTVMTIAGFKIMYQIP